jgi:hypothetical protein
MTTMKFNSLGGFAAHLLTIEADLLPRISHSSDTEL